MHQVVAVQVFVGQHAEDIVEHRGGRLDVRVVYYAAWLKAGEDELIYILLQRYAILQAYTHGYGKGVHERAHGSAFLSHVDEYFTNGTIAILTCAQEEGLSAYLALEGVAATLGGEVFAFYYAGEFA